MCVAHALCGGRPADGRGKLEVVMFRRFLMLGLFAAAMVMAEGLVSPIVFDGFNSAIAEQVRPGDKRYGKVSNGDCGCKRQCRAGKEPRGHPWNLTKAQCVSHCEVRFPNGCVKGSIRK